ncbi:hypothetical protein WDJ51_11280 [Rathayibacter sp. YIM 133350]|uniref:hypothetical protein n=1 Tax=Rathayibacter sp. YIM 133350 TaxID=3131992 RepID=UPI00307F60AB
MSFNGVGDFWLQPGASTRIALARGNLVPDEEWGGEDFGAQWIMADPQHNGRGSHEGRLMVSEHTKERKAIRRHPDSPNPVVYIVTVTNIGGEGCSFSIQGGGNV